MTNPLASYIRTASPAQPTARPANPLTPFIDEGQAAPEPERSALDYIGETISNIPSSAGSVASDLWQAISSPLDTAAALGSAAMGGGQLLKDALGIPSPGLLGEHRPAARAVGQHYSDRYGGFDEIADTMRTDPVGTALDFGGLVAGGAGAAARLPGTAGRVAQAVVAADPIAAGGRAVVSGGRAAETAYRGRRATPSKAQFIADAPTPEALQRQGSALFEAAEKSGVRFKADYFDKFADDILSTLVSEGGDRILTPKISRISDVLEQAKGGGASIQQMAILRKQFSNAAGSADRAEARLGAIAVNAVDDFVEGGASAVGGDLKAARVFWSRLKKSELIDTAIENASTAQAGLEAGLRAEFKTLWRARDSKKMRGFTADELDAIRAVSQGNFAANVLRRIGSLGGGLDQGRNMMNLAVGSGAGAMVGGPLGAAAVPLAGYAAARVSKAGTQNRANLARAIAARGEMPTPTSTPRTLVVDKLLAQGAARRYKRGVAPVAAPVAIGAERSQQDARRRR